ncbi:HNH endonuclease signature motif containing protein [Cutibacterium sp. V970]|uniref:HNH endonuclease signature motif containing protein n=1 Tax=Cutibacterium sp. V970 TaxID=3446481 RepID=UPI003EDF75A6
MSNYGGDDLRKAVEEQMARGNASKRAREVARIILERRSCTTSDLEALGYKHSPRAVRDLRESGVELVTENERYTDPATGQNKSRARYTIVGIDPNRKSRRAFSKKISDAVKSTGRCEVCGVSGGVLQVDHRVPFEIGGESYPHVLSELMPLCPSCNRAKSWQCENCPNWELKELNTCKTYMWASPEKYFHVATKQVREIRVVLQNEEAITAFDNLRPNVKSILEKWLLDRTLERQPDTNSD